MSKQIAITNEKQLISGIKKDAENFSDCANKAIHYAISAGEKLIKLKEITPRGEWEKRLKNDFQDVFGVRQLQRFMEIAESKYLAIELNSDKTLTIEQTIKAFSEATPEQLEKAEQLKAEEEQKRIQAEADKVAKAEAKKQPEIIEGEFTEVKAPAPKDEPKKEEVKKGFVQIESEKLEEIEDSLHELASLNNTISKDNASMVRVFDANDQLGAAAKEIKRLNDLNTSLEGRLNGFMTDRNALIKEAKYWRSKFEKLEKSVAANV